MAARLLAQDRFERFQRREADAAHLVHGRHAHLPVGVARGVRQQRQAAGAESAEGGGGVDALIPISVSEHALVPVRLRVRGEGEQKRERDQG